MEGTAARPAGRVSRVAVLGAGNGGLAFAGYLASRGVSVHLYNRTSPAIAALGKSPQITLTNRLCCSGIPERVTTDLGAAVEGCDLILVTVPASAHESLLTALESHLRDGQTVLLNPGGVGGWLVHQGRGAFAAATLAETSNLLYGCRRTVRATVDISGVKNRIFLYGLPEDLRAEVEAWFPQFVASASPLETGLNTTNVVVHCPVLATHLDAIVAGELRYFYADGMDEKAADLTERFEVERAALCRAYGVRVITLRELYHEAEGETLYDLLRNRLGDSLIAAPDSLAHRFFAEDIPFGLVPMIDLAELAGVEAPVMREALARFQGVGDWFAGARRIRAEHLNALAP